MVADEGLKNINLYDIFANIVPGLAFLFGLIVPFNIIPALKLLLAAEVPIRFGIAHLLLLVFVAFIVGQFLQAFGSRYDGDHGFDSLVKKIRGDDIECRYDVTEFDNLFWELCRERFVLSDDFESHDRLFKAILSYLENSERTRALRMQALYLFARGVLFASVFLFLFYYAIFVSLSYGYLPEEWSHLFRPQWAIGLSSIVATLIAYISEQERRELEADWITYTLTEFYLEVIEE